MALAQLGRREYGDSDQIAFAAYGFSGGLNVKSAPEMVDDADLTQALNVYLQADGGVQMRKGYVQSLVVPSGVAPINGLAHLNQQVVAGAPVPVNAALLSQSNGNLYVVGLGFNPGPFFLGGAASEPWSAVQVYDPDDPAGATDVMVICTGSGGPYVYDGATLYTPTGWASVAGAKWCTVVNDILWFGGIPSQPNLVQGMTIGHPEQLAGYNAFAMSNPVTGLGIVGSGTQAGLVAGLVTGISVIYGTAPGNFSQQDIPSADGVASGRSMVSYQGVLFYLGRWGFNAFDGVSQPQVLSQKIEPLIQNTAYPSSSNVVRVFSFKGSRARCFAFLYLNRIYLGYSASGGINDTYMVLDLTTGGWTIVQMADPTNSAVVLSGPLAQIPEPVLMGSSTGPQVFTFDVNDPGANTTSDNGAPINALIRTKFFKVGNPGTAKTLLELTPEIFASQNLTMACGVITDYGTTIGEQPLIGTGQSSTSQAYVNPVSRLGFNIQGESFSFAFQTTDTNPPWLFGGLSGAFYQGARA